MQYFFKQSLHVPDARCPVTGLEKSGKDYKRGVNEVPEGAEYDPVFIKYVDLGLIEEVEAKVEVAQRSVVDRRQALVKRLVEKKLIPAPPSEVPKEEAVFEEPKEVPAVKGKKKKG